MGDSEGQGEVNGEDVGEAQVKEEQVRVLPHLVEIVVAEGGDYQEEPVYVGQEKKIQARDGTLILLAAERS